MRGLKTRTFEDSPSLKACDDDCKSSSSHTFDEWVNVYEKRTGGKFEPREDEVMFWHPERGILTVLADSAEKCLEVHYCVGDGKFWQKQIVAILRALGFNRARFFTRRNPEAWMRRYGGHLRGWYMEVSLDEAKD